MIVNFAEILEKGGRFLLPWNENETEEREKSINKRSGTSNKCPCLRVCHFGMKRLRFFL